MSNFRSNRQETTEAIMMFRDDVVVTEMLYPEFEAVLDNVISMPDWAGQQPRLAYVLISPGLHVRAVVLFYLTFDENGTADSSWNVPLRQLAEKAEYGPDLGSGLIRLVCRSQSPVADLQMYLWDPELTPDNNHLHAIRDAAKRNQLRLVAEDENETAVTTFKLDKLQIVAEETWRLPDKEECKQEDWPEEARRLQRAQRLKQMQEHERQLAEQESEKHKKADQLIKQQRLHIRNLEAEHERAMGSLREHAASQQAQSEERIRQLERDLQAGQEQNLALQEQVRQLDSIAEQAIDELQSLAAESWTCSGNSLSRSCRPRRVC